MKEFNLSKEKKLAIEKAKDFKENFNCSDCSDCSNCSNCSYCSDCSDCSNCYDCYNCPNCSNCSNCFNCAYCSNCYNCLDKKYMICDIQFTKEEYEAWKKNLI